MTTKMMTEMTGVIISSGWDDFSAGVSLPEDYPVLGDTLLDRTNDRLVGLVSDRRDSIKQILLQMNRTEVEPSASDEDAKLKLNEKLLVFTGNFRIVFVPSAALPFCCIIRCPVDGTEKISLDHCKIVQAMTELIGDATLSDNEKVRHLSLLAELNNVDLRNC